MHKKASDPNFRMGMHLGAILTGNDDRSLDSRMAQDAVMGSVEAAPFNRELCKIACAAYEVTEDTSNPVYHLYRNLTSTQEWHTQYNRFTDPIKRSLSKQAGVLPAMFALHDKTGGGYVRNAVAGSALGGAALGSLAFLISRNARQTSARNAEMMEKIVAYKQLKRDIEEDMYATGSADVEEQKEKYHV